MVAAAAIERSKPGHHVRNGRSAARSSISTPRARSVRLASSQRPAAVFVVKVCGPGLSRPVSGSGHLASHRPDRSLRVASHARLLPTTYPASGAPLVSAQRRSARHTEWHGREAGTYLRRSALIAQGIEHRFPKPCVAGSNPAGGTVREWPLLPPPAQTAPSHLSVSHPRCPRHAELYCSLMHANCTAAVLAASPGCLSGTANRGPWARGLSRGPRVFHALGRPHVGLRPLQQRASSPKAIKERAARSATRR
jgi:hypothetical protein